MERFTAEGGYARRQVYELVQNAADALIGHDGGRIHVLLTEDALYCANEGSPIDAEGVDAILGAYLSVKRGTEIGRFGLGFKSVLGVTSAPEFYSRSGSFVFDGAHSARESAKSCRGASNPGAAHGETGECSQGGRERRCAWHTHVLGGHRCEAAAKARRIVMAG